MNGWRAATVQRLRPRWVNAALPACTLLAAAGACAGGATPTAQCDPDPAAYGAGAFNAQDGARVDARAVELTFTLRTTVDEHFAAVPRLQTDLGQVVDAVVSGARLQVVLLVPAGVDLQGTVRLEGDISASYGEGRQRCAFERAFTVLEADSTVQVR